jgi:hypothetical protein
MMSQDPKSFALITFSMQYSCLSLLGRVIGVISHIVRLLSLRQGNSTGCMVRYLPYPGRITLDGGLRITRKLVN